MEHLDIHFLNVGHGDCTFVDHPSGRLTMIDISNSKSLPDSDRVALAAFKGLSVDEFNGRGIAIAKGQQSWDSYYRSLMVDPLDYYQRHFASRAIFRYVQTHPDMDHMSGLCNFFLQNNVPVLNVWDTNHHKDFTRAGFDEGRYDWDDWVVYGRMRNGYVQDGAPHRVLHLNPGDEGAFWTADGITVLGPDEDLVEYCDQMEEWNDASYVLRVEYGGRVAILPGDAGEPAWDSVEEGWGPGALKCDILKAAHHGRETGYSETAVEAMSPKIVVCSVGKKPETDASDEYASHGSTVLSTRFHGTLLVRIWADGEVWVCDHEGERVSELPILG